jgi:hypothetical protein
VFTARYALSPYIKQIRFVFKGLKEGNQAIIAKFLQKLADIGSQVPDHDSNSVYVSDGMKVTCTCLE